MQAFRLVSRCGIALALAVCLPAGVAWGQDLEDPFDPEYGPKATRTSRTPSSPRVLAPRQPKPKSQKIEQMVEYYLKMYGKHLESSDWIARSMAVISLSRIDDTRTTDKLLEVLEGDRRTICRVFAWEALHARNGSLDAEQRKRWIAGGSSLARKGSFHGDLRIGLLGLIGSAGPTPENRKAFLKIFHRTNSLDPGDALTLDAMRAVMAKWKDPELTRSLIVEMGNLNNAYRAEHVLGGVGAGIASADSLRDKGSKVMWKTTQSAWVEWFKQNAPAEDAAPLRLRPYTGRSRLIPQAGKVANPRDPKWRKDLELGRLYVDQLDVTFAVDSTGSMMEVIRWIQRDVTKMMRAFGMISREPRIGVTFYRDHGDEYVVKQFPLTDKGQVLAEAISGVTAKGGGDVPEAVYEALRAAVKKQRWSGGDRSVKVVILVGDAAPHPGTLGDIQELVASSVKEGFRFYAVKARTRWGSGDLSSFDQIAAAGKGKAIEVDFPSHSPQPQPRTVGIAAPSYGDEPHRQVVREVLRSILSEGYRDRADPFVNVLLEYLERSVPEKREAFPPRPPPKPAPVHPRGWRGPGGGPGWRERRDPPKPQPPPEAFRPPGALTARPARRFGGGASRKSRTSATRSRTS